MPKILQPVEMNKCLGCFSCMSVCSVAQQRDHSLKKSAIKVRTTGVMTSRFIAIVCLGCQEPACMEACPTDAISKRDGGGVSVNEKTCIGCRKCQHACIVRAVNFNETTNKPIICKHCGICTRFCPHDCLQMLEATGGQGQ